MKSIYPIVKKINQSSWNWIVCTLDGYLVEVGLLLPVWVMVVLAFERFFCIMWPLSNNNFSTPEYTYNKHSILSCLEEPLKNKC